MSKKIIFVSILLTIVISLPLKAKVERVKVDDLIFLPNRAYFAEVHKALNDAKKSIYVVMYGMLPGFSAKQPPNILIQDLIEAHKRGIKVEVILDESFKGFDQKPLNMQASTLLRENKVSVRFDSKEVITHNKLIVIDEYVTILGSHNWSTGAFQLNNESSVLIKSKTVAHEFLRYIGTIDTESGPVKIVFQRPTLKDVSALATKANAETTLSMAENYYLNKMYDQALEQYQKLIKEFPKSEEASIARKRIQEIKSKIKK